MFPLTRFLRSLDLDSPWLSYNTSSTSTDTPLAFSQPPAPRPSLSQPPPPPTTTMAPPQHAGQESDEPYVPWAKREGWEDVQPTAQNDAPNCLVPIAYDEFCTSSPAPLLLKELTSFCDRRPRRYGHLPLPRRQARTESARSRVDGIDHSDEPRSLLCLVRPSTSTAMPRHY